MAKKGVKCNFEVLQNKQEEFSLTIINEAAIWLNNVAINAMIKIYLLSPKSWNS
jgi:hypothetical protein